MGNSSQSGTGSSLEKTKNNSQQTGQIQERIVHLLSDVIQIDCLSFDNFLHSSCVQMINFL